ncbi:hypothetical protein A2U01_0084362, partial [Trifolium medium]|nr:hypothetical protein [Trifolium medium]
IGERVSRTIRVTGESYHRLTTTILPELFRLRAQTGDPP